MKLQLILIQIGIVAMLCPSCIKNTKQNVSSDEEIEKLISTLSLEEKIGQMTNLTLQTIANEEGRKICIDTAKLRDVVVKHHVGSIQNVINHAYSLDEWRGMIDLIQKITLNETRHKIPFLYCIDAVHGANYIYGATLFPHNIGLAATRNLELITQCAQVTAAETRASGVRYNFSPVLDVGRNQQWSRFAETFGEDTYLVGEMGSAAIHGFEGKDVSSPQNVASCMKHFVGYSAPMNGKDRAPAYIPEIVLREYYLPTFEKAIKQGAKTLMVNSGEINGTPVHASKYLLTDVLRTELGFEGMVITDWEDIKKLKDRHRVAKTHKEAVLLAITAGIDMCIVPFDFSFSEDLLALVNEGKVSEERINASVRRILTLKKQVGLFKQPWVEKETLAQFGKETYAGISYQSAVESITLLKNEDHILPLQTSQKVLLTGPNAQSVTALHGAWSYCWQGRNDTLYPSGLSNLADVFASPTTFVVPSFTHKDSTLKNMDAILKKAAMSEIIVVCLGEAAYAETPGNTPDIELDEKQVNLVKALAKTGKPIVAVLIQGRPRIIRTIEPLCKAIVLAYWPGPKGAQAIYDVVYGKFNPCGKLPFTYPRYNGSLITYDHKALDEAVEKVEPEYSYSYEFNPQYPFGHGLSYTSFAYSSLVFQKDTLTTGDSLLIKIKVTNTGKMAGHEVVDVYVSDSVASITPPVKRLKRFQKVFLQPNESKTVSFVLKEADLAFVHENLKKSAESGAFGLQIGTLSKRFYLK